MPVHSETHGRYGTSRARRALIAKRTYHRFVSFTRRTFLAGSALSLALPAWGAAGDDDESTPLRILRVRHRTTLVDIGGARALFDPCFTAGLGAGVLFRAGEPALAPEDAGEVDLLLVGAHEPGAFSGESTARLRGRAASCFVADERTATVLRHQGYKRVRVVVPGDVFETRNVIVRVSPSRGVFGNQHGVGFLLERGGRTFWHAGAPPPLDVADGAVLFARAHRAEVMTACAWGLSVAGAPLTLDREDALILAGLCRARYALLLDDDAGPNAIGGLVLSSRPGSRKPPPGVRVKVVVVEPGRWYRVAPRAP